MQNDKEYEKTSEIAGSFGHIALEGLPNTRDLGYLKTSSGSSIVSQRLIRSGALAEATENDLDILKNHYGLNSVIDLRTQDEREKAPDPQDKMKGVQFFEAPILGASAMGVTREMGLAGMVKSFREVRKDPKQIMKDLYPEMLLEKAGIQGYKRFFELLASSPYEGAILWHCSAGKDRAGLATVLLLYVLEVSWDDIVYDYLATNEFLDGKEDKLKELIPDLLQSEKLLKSLKIINSADEEFLNAGVDKVKTEFGSLDTYLQTALGVDEAMKEQLRQTFVR